LLSTASSSNAPRVSRPAAIGYRTGARDEPVTLGLPLSTWIQIGAIAAVMAALFWPNLRRLILKTNPFTGEANWGHSVVIPVIGLYYLYVNRDELLRAKVRPLFLSPFTKPRVVWSVLLIALGAFAYFVGPVFAPSLASTIHVAGNGLMIWGALALVLDWGLATLLFGIMVAAYGIYPGRNDTLWDYGLVVTLFGVVLLLCGWEVMKIAWFPIVFLFAAIPFPGLVYSWIAGPLQVIAAQVAVFTLQLTGVDAVVNGTKIHIGSGIAEHTLNVAEACAGLRSLMTFISVAAAIAFLSARPLWQKLVLTASAVPIAVLCNVMRVSVQGLVDHYWSREMSEGFAHQFVGMAMLVPAFFLILGVGWLLDKIFVEEVAAEPSETPRVRRPKRRPPGMHAMPVPVNANAEGK
jgi:exosortase